MPFLCLYKPSSHSVVPAGIVTGQTAGFASVEEAVQKLPELSTLNAQVSKIELAAKLRDSNFVGTVFAPINSVSSRQLPAPTVTKGRHILQQTCNQHIMQRSWSWHRDPKALGKSICSQQQGGLLDMIVMPYIHSMYF